MRKTFPQENLEITVEDFGYFCVNGVVIQINKNRVVVGYYLEFYVGMKIYLHLVHFDFTFWQRIEHIELQFLWEEFKCVMIFLNAYPHE